MLKKSLILLFLFTLQIFSQTDPVVQKIIDIGKTNNQTMDHLDILTNRFGGRPIGSDAYENAAEWVAYKFNQWGMKVIMDEAGDLPVGFNRGPWFGRMLSHDGMILHFATPSYTSGTKGVQKGHVLIEPKTQKEFDRMKGKLKGGWILITGESDGFPIDFSDIANKRRDSLITKNLEISKLNSEIKKFNKEEKDSSKHKSLIAKVDEPALFYKQMVEAGILGIIQSTKNPIRVLYDRKNLHNLKFETLPTVPDIKLDEHQFNVIYQKAKERQRFELEFDIRNHFKMGPVKYHSVIGVIEGTDFPDEYVIMSGHLDAYDVATGAVDDGNGCSVVMEAGRLIMEAGGKPKRTILVILWAGEEYGLYGSKSWLTRNKEKHDKISNMFNRDGGPLVTTSIAVSNKMRVDIEKICNPLNDINPEFPFEIKERKPRKRPTKPWGTDSGPFAVEGIPTMSFGEEDYNGYNFNYREIWHTERDTYNMVFPDYMQHSSIVFAVVVYGVANLDHLLDRTGYYLEPTLNKTKE